MEILRDLWSFLKYRKKWWLFPIVVFLLLVSFLGIMISSSSAVPFIYSLF